MQTENNNGNTVQTENKTNINWLIIQHEKTNERLDSIQFKQSLEMTVLFLSIATFLISHFS